MTEIFGGIDLVTLIKTVGYLGVFGIIFAESGLFVGFFLPGDSLLFTAGFLASQNFINIWALAFIAFGGAVLGDNFGYAFGRRIGPALFSREDSRIFKKKYLHYAQSYYEKNGPPTIVLARFVPIVRTFAPILAGVGRMHYRTFVFYNLFGGFIWTFGLSFLGYFLGSVVPNIDNYLLPVILAVIIISFIPGVWHIIKNRNDFKQ
ncbi:VTT domain-containing protein [Candidatus Giovannonibacteria bacterium]|nr:VTT domain-containing protein [Candidatus Giovannonibacteria bacterium]